MSNKTSTEYSSASCTQQMANGKTTEVKSTSYVVLRDGGRVSDKEYCSPSDPACIAEVKFWDGIAKKHSYGEKVSAVVYNSKLHRVW